jgi:hypothetical protein
MTKAPKNIAASVRSRLLKLARERREDFQLLLVRYANERLLYRLGSSKHGSRFVLNGENLRRWALVDVSGLGQIPVPIKQHDRARIVCVTCRHRRSLLAKTSSAICSMRLNGSRRRDGAS